MNVAKFGIGQPLRRVEDQRLLTGGGRYTDDYTPPGACFRRAAQSRMRMRTSQSPTLRRPGP